MSFRKSYLSFFWVSLVFVSLNTNAIDCKIQTINLTAKESSEIYNLNNYRELRGEQELLILNFSINNSVDSKIFFNKMKDYIKEEKGEFDINSLNFIDLVSSMNKNNMLAVLNIFGENHYDEKTNLYFKNTKIRMRYKDIINEALMVRLGENLWLNYYPYPSWNVPRPEGKYSFQYPYKSKFTLPPYNKENIHYIKPILKSEREWKKYNGEFEYNVLLSGYYDKNTYYTWRDEWLNQKNRNNGEWHRDYAWLKKTISEYKGSNLELIKKLVTAKDDLQGFCN